MQNEKKNIPRPEFPRPQFDRGAEKFINLNGLWEYETDRGLSGEARGLYMDGAEYRETITVPFCRESVLSGIGDADFCEGAWYRRSFILPDAWRDGRTLLHIGACDYEAKVWVNGTYIGKHFGGYVSFSFDITKALCECENTVVIGVKDFVRTEDQPAGKQSQRYHSHGCSYTRTTGIWQTVWLERVPMDYIKGTKYYPDIDRGMLRIEADIVGGEGMTLSAKAYYDGNFEGEDAVTVHGGRAELVVPLAHTHLWEVGHGRLYDLTLTLSAGDGRETDAVQSYFGMRKIECRDGIFYLNGKPVFQRLILDQGFYPDGIYTAPTKEELEADIDRALVMGFNGARLHQKVFEPLFLSMCDRKGYLVWGEHANWGLDISRKAAYKSFISEWCEVLQRDFNHPAIIGWCPLNETQHNQDHDLVRLCANVTRQYDRTRMYIDTSGWYHVDGVTDMMDEHNYDQNPETFAKRYAPLKEKGGAVNVHHFFSREHAFLTAPTFISEYGGIRWAPEEDAGWGYGDAPKTREEFLARFKGLTEAILFHPRMSGLCYTQLTDVEQEVNGLYTYNRQAKFAPEEIAEVLTQTAAIEMGFEKGE